MTTFYTIGAILAVVLPLFTKFGKKPTWKRIMDKVKPTTDVPSTPDKVSWFDPIVFKILAQMVEQIARKTPPSPDVALPTPTKEPSTVQELLAWLATMVNFPTSPTTPVTTAPLAPIEHEDKLAQLVACAKQLALAEPDFDVVVSITETDGVKVVQSPRAKVVNAKP